MRLLFIKSCSAEWHCTVHIMVKRAPVGAKSLSKVYFVFSILLLEMLQNIDWSIAVPRLIRTALTYVCSIDCLLREPGLRKQDGNSSGVGQTTNKKT